MTGKQETSFGTLIGASPVMRSVYRRIEKAAATEVTVLLTGESGTGKELAAQEIHGRSARADGPFVPVNAGAIPAELTASELFGHEPGAYTGAQGRRKGKFESADGGTLFLDEIAATDMATQISLLRALEERAIYRLGGQDSIPVDVRFLAATNESLTKAIGDGRFREDLYYRLDILQIRMPPLRERENDVRLLAETFLTSMAEAHGRVIDGFSDEALTCILGYPWPGNVRELRNCVLRAVVSSENTKILRKDLPRRLQKVARETREVRFKLSRNLGDIEREYVMRTLEECSGNKLEASKRLGISRKSLYDKLARWEDAESGDGDVYHLGDEETTPIQIPPDFMDREKDEDEG